MSARRPPSRSFAPRNASPTTKSSTVKLVCAVCGSPVLGSFICSALPWSAVITRLPPRASAAAMIWPTHSSTTSHAFTTAGRLPVWPTMSGLAKFTTMNGSQSGAARRASTASRTPYALIWGFWS